MYILITKRDKKMINHALNMAEMSNFPKYHIGCVVAQKGKVLNASFNSQKTHPVQKKYNKFRFEYDNTPHSVHAEIHALSQICNEDIDWKNVTVYIARKRKCDCEYGIAKPCSACMNMMKNLGIRNIVYTTDFGIACEEIL